MIILSLVFIIISCAIGASWFLLPFLIVGMIIFSAIEEISRDSKKK